MAIKQFAGTAPSSLVGVYLFSQAAGLDAKELQLVHPDNVLGMEALGFEAISTVCHTLGVKNASMAKLTYVSDAYVKKSFSNPEKGMEFISQIQGALHEALSDLSPEDDFEGDETPTVIKRAIRKTGTMVDRIVDAGGALVLIHLLYLTIIENQLDTATELAMLLVHLDETTVFVSAFNEKVTVETGMLELAASATKYAHTQMTKWAKANATFINKNCEYCEVTDE